ncbi:MAG TPA: Ig-like domain-containing protein, partial [Saprospiraceae bacterium]
MKSTTLLPSLDGQNILLSCIKRIAFICCLFISSANLYSQQTSLPCNTVTPWVPDTFDVDVDFSSDLLSCWGGDPLCLVTGAFDPGNVVDTDLNNFATGEILLGGSLTLSVTDPVNTYDAGNFAGFVISTGLLDANLFSSITVRTYNNNVLQETHPGFDLIGLNSGLFTGPYTVGFVTNTTFDEIEIIFAAGIVAGFYNVHYAVMEGFCEGPEPACNVETQMNSPVYPMTIDYELTGSTGINLGIVDDPESAISPSTADFASFENLANVFDTVSIAVEEQITDYPEGTFVGFDIQNISILGLDLLENMVITSYLNGIQQEVVIGNDLLLGAPLLNNSGRMTVGFVTNTAVDKVRFSIAYPLNVDLGITLIYSAIFRKFCEGPPLPCNELTPLSSPEYPVYFNVANSGFTGAACVGCTLEDPGNVIDNDADSYAEIDITAGVATIGSISIKDALTDYPENTFAGFHIENVQLVDVDVLTGITITTYLDGAFAEQVSGTDILLTAGTDLLVNQGEFFAGFVTDEPFDEVRISLTNVGMVNIGTTRIYETVIGAFCPAEIECDTNYFLNTPEFPVYIDYQLTGMNGVACALCEVEDADEVITASNTDYATIMITAGVLEIGSIAVRDALYIYPPGTIAGFVIDDVNDLLQADLFGSLTISTWLDGSLQEFAFGANLIDAELLILFINPDAGVYNVGFKTTMPFDEIRISVGALASVINIINVYGAFVDTRSSQGGDLACQDPPVAVDDIATTPEDTPIDIDVLANDSDPDSPLGIPVVTEPPSHGMTMVNPGDSTITYTPDPGFVGVDSFMYAICDDGLPPLCDTATVIVTVTPFIDTIYETIPEDSLFTVCADELTTFTEPATSLALCDEPSNGSVLIVGTCTTYTPDSNFTGQDTFCLVVCDPNDPLLCDTTIVIITVTPVNDPPVAEDDMATTPEDTPIDIDVLANDSDPDSPLGIPTVTDPPSHGMTMVNPGDSTITYTPDPDFVGVDSFMYAICDDGIPPLCDTAVVIVTVTPEIDTIIVILPEDSTFTVCASELTTFTEPATSISSCDDPGDGTVSIIDTCATYTPDPGFNGQDTFCLVVCDPNTPLLCDTTIVIIIIDTLNNPPVAVDDSATTPEDTPVDIDVLVNDSDPDSPLGIPDVTEPPANGMAMVNPGDSTITYTPDPDFVGIDSFMYEICDNGVPSLCDTATVVITVTPVIDTIYETIPEDSMFTVCANELTTFTEPATSIALCEEPSNGTVVITGTCATYTPYPNFNGQDTFCLVVCDPNIPLLCDTTIVIVTVTPVNDPPVAVDDMATTPEDTPVDIDVLANDSDPDSPLDIPEITEPPSHGMVIVNTGDSTVTYTPDPDFVGVDSFMYAICDDGIPSLCDTALVVVTITPVIDTIYVTIPEDSSFQVCADELTMFSVPATTISLCEEPVEGMVTNTGICALYNPDAGYDGQDTFCLTVCDPNNPLLCDTTIVIITIIPPGCVYVNAFVYLEGAAILANGNEEYALPMRNSLNQIGVLPGQCYEDPFFGIQYTPSGQPYSVPPWNYMGLEGNFFNSEGNPDNGSAGYPETTVDWILVSLRENPDSDGVPICQAAGLLQQDGSILFVDTFTCCGINLSIPYYIVIEHRNHLLVMSDTLVEVLNDTLTYD